MINSTRRKEKLSGPSTLTGTHRFMSHEPQGVLPSSRSSLLWWSHRSLECKPSSCVASNFRASGVASFSDLRHWQRRSKPSIPLPASFFLSLPQLVHKTSPRLWIWIYLGGRLCPGLQYSVLAEWSSTPHQTQMVLPFPNGIIRISHETEANRLR